jgi:FkbM family methyltransferase
MELRTQLESMLSESTASANDREQNTFDQLTAGKTPLVLFGAGGLGRKVLHALRNEGIEPLAFIDNKMAGTIVEGLQVLRPAEAAERWGQSSTFVVTIWAAWADTMQEQVQSLRRLGCQNVVSFIPLLWKYPQTLPHVQVDLPSRLLEQKDRVLQAFDLLSDRESKAEFLGQVRWRLFGDFNALHAAIPNQYWQRDLIRLPEDACFVDVGAFDGDTLEQFVSFTQGRFRRAYLFEPDPANLAAIAERLARLSGAQRDRVQVFPFAVADSDYQASFHAGAGASSSVGSGGTTTHCVALDDVLPQSPSYVKPDFMKFDIEGFELLGLSGSRRLIAENTPALAVCAYHVQNHLWEVPIAIQSLNGAYRLSLRPHGQIWETVCYGVGG